MAGIADSLTQGIRRMVMHNAGFTDGQIDAAEQLTQKYPALQNLDLQTLIHPGGDASPAQKQLYSDIKGDVLKMLDNDDLTTKFGTTMQNDPSLVDRMNYLIKNDPAKLKEMMAKFQEKPDELASILKDQVTDDQAVLARNQLEHDQQNPFAGFDFKKIFGDIGSMGLEGIAKILLMLVKGINGMTDFIAGKMKSYTQSPEVVTAGNGVTHKDGPSQQVAAMTGDHDKVVHHEGPDGEVRTATIGDHVTPDGTTPTPGTQPQPTDVAMNRTPGMGPDTTAVG